MWRRLGVIALAAGVGLLAGSAEARPRALEISGLALVQDMRSDAGGLFWVDGCYGEDAWHHRQWTGTLGPGESFSVTIRMCDLWEDGVSQGGVGFYMASYSRRDLSLASIDRHGAVNGGVPLDRYRLHGCRSPFYSRSTEQSVIPGPYPELDVASGNHTITVSNVSAREARDVSLLVDVAMARPSWQENACPLEDWNLG